MEAAFNLRMAGRLPANYHEFDHGYAITAHRSQGKTVDAVVLSGDTMKQEQFYVAASRGRDGITIITSDVDRFANRSASPRRVHRQLNWPESRRRLILHLSMVLLTNLYRTSNRQHRNMRLATGTTSG